MTSGEYLVDGEPRRFSSPREALDLGIAAVYQTLALVPLLPVWRNFFLGSELEKGSGPFRRLDVDADAGEDSRRVASHGHRP